MHPLPKCLLLMMKTLMTFIILELKMERTYIMIKPDGVQRGLIGDILSRFEKKGFKLQVHF